jgi:hypothetical protein
MSELETKLSFPQAISLNKFGGFVDVVSAFSGCNIRLLRESSGELFFKGDYFRFLINKMDGKKYLFDSFSYSSPKNDSAKLELKSKLREAIAGYFLKSDNNFSIPLSKSMSDSGMSVLLSLLQDTLKAEVSLDGRTRMLMDNGKLDVGGSIRKKPHVLAFKCEYRNGKCNEMKICVPSHSALGFYEEVHSFVEEYYAPQRL